MALDNTAEYVAMTRRLLQDEISVAYRYPDSDIVVALNVGIYEAKRVRPDLFLRDNDVTEYSHPPSMAVNLVEDYRQPLVMFMVGFLQTRDSEDNTDQRAFAFRKIFRDQLLGA